MSWQETTTGCYERPLGALEAFYLKICSAGYPIQPSNWSTHAAVTFNVSPSASSDLENLLREAWKALRAKEPDIASTRNGDTKRYMSPDDRQLAAWLEQTYFVEECTTDELLEKSNPESLPSMHYMKASSTPLVVFRFEHWRIDDIGLLLLLKQYFTILAQGCRVATFDGSEAANLSPSVESIINPPSSTPPAEQKRIANIRDEFVAGYPSVGFARPKRNSPMLPARTLRQAVFLAPASLETLLRSCKKRGLTVTAALHSAILTATYSTSPSDEKSRPFTSIMAANLREYIPEPSSDTVHSDTTHAASLCHIGVWPTIKARGTWEGKARQFMEAYSLAKQKWYRSCTKEVTDAFGPFILSRPPAPTSTPLLTSLGVIEKHLPSTFAGPGSAEGCRDTGRLLVRR